MSVIAVDLLEGEFFKSYILVPQRPISDVPVQSYKRKTENKYAQN